MSIDIKISDEAAPLLNDMMRVLGAKDLGDVITQCLMLMQASINAHGQGLQVGFVNSDGAVIPMFQPKPGIIDLKAEKKDEHATVAPKAE